MAYVTYKFIIHHYLYIKCTTEKPFLPVHLQEVQTTLVNTLPPAVCTVTQKQQVKLTRM